MSKQITEAELLAREKSFVDKIGSGTVLTLAVLTISLISTFAVCQYKIGELESKVAVLSEDSKSYSALVQEVKDIKISLEDVKNQNRVTYSVLLDLSHRK